MFLKTSTLHGTRNMIGLNTQLSVTHVFDIHIICLAHMQGSGREPVITTVGFRSWKHATGKTGALYVHSNFYSHKQAVIAWEQIQDQCKASYFVT